jgi:hypothetical protein
MMIHVILPTLVSSGGNLKMSRSTAAYKILTPIFPYCGCMLEFCNGVAMDHSSTYQ